MEYEFELSPKYSIGQATEAMKSAIQKFQRGEVMKGGSSFWHIIVITDLTLDLKGLPIPIFYKKLHART